MNRISSWMGADHAGDQQQYSSWSSMPVNNQTSSGRREHAVQPPLLTTALGAPQFHHASTPLSSTSLSSPFTQAHSPYVASPVHARSTPSSSMASRQQTSFNVPYNPQEWGPVGAASAQAAYSQANSVHRVSPQPQIQSDVPVSPPPPPYSPPSNRTQMPQEFTSPNPNISVTPTVTPPQHSSPESNINMNVEYQRRSVPRPRPVSMIYSNDSGLQQSLPPPPPPQGNRSVSQSRMDHYQGAPHNSAAFHSRARVSMSYEQALPSPSLRGSVMGPSADELETPSRPPASRRAASAGAIVSSVSSSRNRSPSNSGWTPGMPLPPPPPGPPPTARAVSASGSSEGSSTRTVQGSSRIRPRPPPIMGNGLGSIPPTPADWVDEEYMKHRPSRDHEPLHIDTTRSIPMPDPTGNPDMDEPEYQSQKTPGSGGLFRSSAIRDPSAKGIRERRIERRNRQSQVFEDMSAVSSSGNPWADALEQIKPSNLVFPEHRQSPDPTRHPTSSRKTPQSTRSTGSEGLRTASRSRASSTGLFSEQSPQSTPKPEPSAAGPSAAFAQTPPFSPGASSSTFQRETPQVIPPRALPTPPLSSAKEALSRSRAASRGSEERPVSHILHLPNDALSMMKPLSPRRLSITQTNQQASLESVIRQETDFVRDAVQRHQRFIEQEAAALNEAEAMKVFTDFIIAESQIRRERYAAVWDSDSFGLDGVRNKLFEMPPLEANMSTKPNRPMPTLEIPATRASRPESAWWNNYQPCLSPIASLSMSNDEMSSRGRAPSRWWESKTGSSSEECGRKVHRSKRESKYMGLPRDSIQWDQERTPSKLDDADANYTYQFKAYGPDEYPPEKVDCHEEASAYPDYGDGDRREQFRTPQKLDISRLITLPPPYPRHYPAVNNSHPELISYRTTVRSITDLTEIKSTRQRYKDDVETMAQEHKIQVKDGRRQFKSNIQSQIQEGSLTFAEAAEAEAAMIADENKRARALAKRELDTYQETVLKPMVAILNDRIARASTCIDELSSRLFDDAQHETPDQTQEEGDEKPELLEKLTQLKWLFEAREQLHRESFELVSDRDDKYKVVALLPYKQSQNEDKIRETQAFFAKDALDRRVQYETQAFSRLESFMDVIEQNVVRGVEKQLSAFWDIAPSLLALVQQVPDSLHGLQVQIPADEYRENPSYHTHPLQYLYTLLSHAEKSSYQYIESQINLLCLLHEVRSAVMRANRNLAEAERIWQGESEENVRREMQTARADEEVALTTDLKDKVSTVEGQWTEALGSQIQGLRERVKAQLVAEDGWEDLEQLEQE
ncbi:hypothetical protein N7523_009564 [Penicillium sp. IBT 18751x]|nr:hypothetical protein N7523_009564 [Penicillium sp. IBT 18751x]